MGEEACLISSNTSYRPLTVYVFLFLYLSVS